MLAELCFSVDDFVGFFFRSIALLVLISPPHQVRTAAHTASEYDSCGHRRCWTAAASKGLFCLVCIVLVLVAVRFGSWTMMAELCFSIYDIIVLFSSNFSNWYIRVYIYVSWEPADTRYKQTCSHQFTNICGTYYVPHPGTYVCPYTYLDSRLITSWYQVRTYVVHNTTH